MTSKTDMTHNLTNTDQLAGYETARRTRRVTTVGMHAAMPPHLRRARATNWLIGYRLGLADNHRGAAIRNAQRRM